MHKFRIHSILLFLSLTFGFSTISARTSMASGTLSRVPADSILVLSVDGKKLISKSGVLKNKQWNPLLERMEENGAPILKWLADSNQSGIAWEESLQFFVRLIEGELPYPQFGAILKTSSAEQADNTISTLANFLGLRPSKNNPKVYQRATQPFAIGRSGEFCFLLGTLFFPQQIAPPDNDLNTFIASLSAEGLPASMPSSLANHAKHSADVSLYVEGTGNSRMFENLSGNTLLGSIFPLFDPLLQDSFGIFLKSQPGNIKIEAHNYSLPDQVGKHEVVPLELINQIPGDAPLVARISLPEDRFQSFLTGAVDTVLKFLSGNKLGADTDLPGFDLSARELLKFPSGDFVVAGGNSKIQRISLHNGQSIVKSTPIWAGGMKIAHPMAYREILAGMNAGMGFSHLLEVHQLKLTESKDSVWISSPEYSREIKLGKPIEPLSFERRKLLSNHQFALDFNPKTAARSLREPEGLSFDQLKQISWLDDYRNFSMCLTEKGILRGNLQLSQPEKQGWEVLADRLAQEWIDQINARLFLAISQDDLNEVIESVAMGALINANDRFGHSPIHYAAYRGNAYIVDYLLRNGGDPNARGNHQSTPLHSAAWGKNQEVVELLLEDGAEVDAKTDELETPIMTATLRGQKEMVETLLALSADAHAVDKYGSNLMDLAGASGNKQLVELLTEVGVKISYPLHLAAGTGDFTSIKSLLESGHSINEQDSFGATPLLIATVAGREDIVDYLLEHSADPTIEAKDGYSLIHGAAFSGKKSLVRKMLTYGLNMNQRYGTDKITPTDVGEEGSEGLIYLRSMGGRSAWELGPE
jgi:ankyrin repeat protein